MDDGANDDDDDYDEMKQRQDRLCRTIERTKLQDTGIVTTVHPYCPDLSEIFPTWPHHWREPNRVSTIFSVSLKNITSHSMHSSK